VDPQTEGTLTFIAKPGTKAGSGDGMVILANSESGGKFIARATEAMEVPGGFQAFLRLQAGEAP